MELTTQLVNNCLAGWERLGKFDINSPKYWWDDVPAWLFGCFSLWLLPIFIFVDFVIFFAELGAQVGASIDNAFNAPKPLTENQRRLAEAERARQAWLVDLRIAESIDDPDTREMAITHASNKYHRRLAEVMGE